MSHDSSYTELFSGLSVISLGDLWNWSGGSSTWKILFLRSWSWIGESSYLRLKLSGLVDCYTFLFHYICLHDFERILAWLMFCISLQIFRYSSKIAGHGKAKQEQLNYNFIVASVSSKMKSNALQFFPVCCERYNNVKNC